MSLWIRKGYDPRQDRASCKYQATVYTLPANWCATTDFRKFILDSSILQCNFHYNIKHMINRFSMISLLHDTHALEANAVAV